jgi:hypothetical protein
MSGNKKLKKYMLKDKEQREMKKGRGKRRCNRFRCRNSKGDANKEIRKRGNNAQRTGDMRKGIQETSTHISCMSNSDSHSY